MDILEKIKHIIFTTKCLFCNELLYSDEIVCDKCLNMVDNLPNDRCSFCGYFDCRCSNQFAFSYVISPFVYGDVVKEAIIAMKFNGLGYNAHAFAKFIFNRINYFRFKDEIDFIVEVPMYYKKRLYRGYNQSELLAKYLSKEMNLKYKKRIIKKIRNTKEQNKLDYKSRKTNLLGCYKITDKNKVKDKNILLVDDVFTTGSTANECSKALLESGAKQVFVATCCIVKKKDKM